MKNVKARITCFFFYAVLFSFNMIAHSATVTYVRGKAEVCRNNEWVAIKTGDVIDASETISTGFQSEVKLKYKDSVMALGALTRVTLDTLSSDDEKDTVSLYINTGAIRSKVNRTENKKISYAVKSPVAVASVRGTDFLVTGAGSVSCREGMVAVTANTEKKRLASNGSPMQTDEQPEELEIEEQDVGQQEDFGKGAVMVGKNQSVEIQPTGLPNTPRDNNDRQRQQFINPISNPAESEAVALGGERGRDRDMGKTGEGENPAEKSSSRINVKVTLED